eukprot:TRINITY_DN33600_c0_g1_i1.p1 TRINITY_DN33600_c0_g1~~TRINITY_DN33600_c0_g1_i1.p1  ORF type:complete len:301 (+),score=69.28 TRINITY_DN33600_c0_g1_i1:31-933(+)
MFLSRNVLVRNALANPLGGQRRTAAKIVAGQPKGEIRAGKGRNMSRKLGWKRMPGMIIETGSAIHRVQALTGISLHEHDDEMPFDLYPGLNTVRNGRGDILATVDGVVRLSKLPGTEGTADKAFLWVDPNIRDYMVREMERHMHRERGNEFAIEEVESRFISSPRWSHKEDREQELKDWLYNPQWDLPEESRNYSKAIPRTHLKYAKTEREKYEERDHDMFYSRMPDRSRSYAFGGKNYRYENARLEKDPVGVKEFQVQPFAYPTSGAGMARYLRRHDRRHAIKDQNRIYHLSALFGHFW